MDDIFSTMYVLLNQFKDMGMSVRVIFYADRSGAVECWHGPLGSTEFRKSFTGPEDMLLVLANEIQRKEYRRLFTKTLIEQIKENWEKWTE